MIVAPFSFQYKRHTTPLHSPEPLHYDHHQVIWLVGSSGSGKSTFLNLLKGFYPEFLAGQLQGQSPAVFADAMYLSQNPQSQIVHQHVGEEFVLSMEFASWSVEQIQAQWHWLDRFGLSNQEWQDTSLLSHGLAQRLLLASMLAIHPNWLLLDEPTAFLDPTMRDAFYQTLSALKGHVGMVIIDHHRHAAQIADVCWYVDQTGKITAISVEEWLAMEQTWIDAEHEHQHNHPLLLPPLQSKYVLQAHDLTIGYPSTPLYTANFTLNSGDCAVLTGINGSGKSTLLNTLAGVQSPLSGQFCLYEDHVKLKKPARKMSYVFQHPDSHFYFDTVQDELAQLGAEQIESTLEQFDLNHTAHKSPHQLSEGQKRRLTLLYPHFQSQPVVLLDEPTFGQDAVNVERVIQMVQALKQAGYILIVISHDPVVLDAVVTQHWDITQGQLNVHPKIVAST